VFDAVPSGIWFIVLASLAYILTAMIVAIIREERPNEYDEISAPSDMFSSVASPFYLAFSFIIPMKYESWELSQAQKWVCRLALVVYVSLLLLIFWMLVSLLRFN
jgi:hypothetical protein